MFKRVVIIGVGFTVIRIVLVEPVQELAAGLTVMVLLIGELDVFVALKALIFPFPDATKPMLVFVFVQV